MTKKDGYVYVLTNVTMPGYIKIGITTTSVEKRVKELSSSTSIPLPFECYYAAKVSDVKKVEAALHDGFGDHRINPRREFFKIAPERIVAILKLLSEKEIEIPSNIGAESKEDVQALEEARQRKSAFNFKMVSIPAGTALKFIRNEKVTCTVAPDQKHVLFQNELMSISTAAQKALGRARLVQGPAYWTYNGEILDERRQRLEENSPSEEEIDAAGDYWQQLQTDISLGK